MTLRELISQVTSNKPLMKYLESFPEFDSNLWFKDEESGLVEIDNFFLDSDNDIILGG